MAKWRESLRRPITERPYKEAVVASGAVASGDNPEKEATAKSGAIRMRQQQVWAYRDQVPELGHAALFYENCFSRIRLTVAYLDDDGSHVPAFKEDGSEAMPGAKEALQAVRELRSAVGGQSQIMRAIGGCLTVVGEGHLVGTPDERLPSKTAWEFLSPSEFFEPANAAAATPGVHEYHRVRAPGQTPEIVKAGPGQEAFVGRVWKPDRQFSTLAWSPPLGMLDIFEELVLLTREIAGSAKSRLALAGLLIVADDIEPPDSDDEEAEGPPKDPFVEDLITVGSTAIREKDSAAGFMPLVVRVAYDRVKDGFNYIEFGRKWNEQASRDRDECITRFAQGINLPVEVVRGHQSTTFANAAQISADMYRLYIEPEVEIACDALTSAYLWTKLPGTPFVIVGDPTDLVVRPDQISDWKDAHDRFVVSDASYRAKLGGTEDDAPDADEIALRLLIKAAGRSAAVATAADVEGGPGDVTPTVGAEPAAPDKTAEPIAAAMEVEVRRVMQRVGARLRSKVSGNRALASVIATVPDPEVAATLGAKEVYRLMTDAELFGREFDVLHAWVLERADRIIADEVRDRARAETARRMNLVSR